MIEIAVAALEATLAAEPLAPAADVTAALADLGAAGVAR
jgi:hypothetical protein